MCGYTRKVKRWTLGTGEISCERYPNRPNFIAFMEKIGGDSLIIRATVLRLGKKSYKVILYQGFNHKDTIRETNRWMYVRQIIENHLCNIDRDLERPLMRFSIPTEDICFDQHVVSKEPPLQFKLGDKVVVPDGQVVTYDGMMQDNKRACVTFPGGIKDCSILVKDLKPLPETIEPLDLPGGKASWLLALDVSASMSEENIREFLSIHRDELQYKISHTVTFDTDIRRKYVGLPQQVTVDTPIGGTSIDCVLGYALVRAYPNVLIFSDGCFEYPKNEQRLNVWIVKTPRGRSEVLLEDKCFPLKGVSETPVKPRNPFGLAGVFEENGYEYWLERLNGTLSLIKKCKNCGEIKSIPACWKF